MPGRAKGEGGVGGGDYNLVMFREDGLFNEVFDDGGQVIHLLFLFTQSQR